MEQPGRIHLPGLDRSLPPRGLRETLRETIGSTYHQQLRLALKRQLIGLSRCMELDSDAVAIAFASMRQRACKRNHCPRWESALPPGPGSS
jgi:hypothetical protein